MLKRCYYLHTDPEALEPTSASWLLECWEEIERAPMKRLNWTWQKGSHKIMYQAEHLIVKVSQEVSLYDSNPLFSIPLLNMSRIL